MDKNVVDIFDDEFINNLGKNLKHFRVLAGFSQEELAAKSQMSTSFYKKIETMQAKNPGIKNIARICNALNIPFDFLVKENGIRLFDTYSNVRMVAEMNELSDDEFALFTKSLSFQYELIKNREQYLKN